MSYDRYMTVIYPVQTFLGFQMRLCADERLGTWTRKAARPAPAWHVLEVASNVTQPECRRTCITVISKKNSSWALVLPPNYWQLFAIIGYYCYYWVVKSIIIIGYYWTTPKTLIIGINRNLLLQLIFLGTNYCN